jgi:ferredoxin-NADP reductase
MSIYTTTLDARTEIAEGTMTFQLCKPIGFNFIAGQAIELTLSDASTVADAQNMRHAFSIVSAPLENHLVVATRMRDSVFKCALRSLPIGSQVTIDGPFGTFGLDNDHARAAIFIAGGIGITPFISILRQAAKGQLRQRFILIYSNRRPEDAAFLAELQQLEEQNLNFRLVATMTEMQASNRSWPNHTGFITADLVASVVGDLPKPVFYVVGPPGMVEAMRETLQKCGIDANDIRSEEFQ